MRYIGCCRVTVGYAGDVSLRCVTRYPCNMRLGFILGVYFRLMRSVCWFVCIIWAMQSSGSVVKLEIEMRVIYKGIQASYNDTFIADAIDNKTGEVVRLVIYCRNLQSVSSYLYGYTATSIR